MDCFGIGVKEGCGTEEGLDSGEIASEDCEFGSGAEVEGREPGNSGTAFEPDFDARDGLDGFDRDWPGWGCRVLGGSVVRSPFGRSLGFGGKIVSLPIGISESSAGSITLTKIGLG